MDGKPDYLSPFQFDCVSSLTRTLLENRQAEILIEIKTGKEECWIEIRLPGNGTHLWIYEDGAEWKKDVKGKIWERSFEWQEFGNDLDALLRCFSDHIVNNL